MSIKMNSDPLVIFSDWLEEAKASDMIEPTAMALASCGENGQPSCRMVLLKGFDEQGFIFYTNFESHKGQQLEENARAALCFYWDPLHRQVRIEGSVEKVSDQEADTYFASRDRKSRIGAWASQQSRPLSNMQSLLAEVAKVTAKHNVGEIPRPEYWGGYRVIPNRIEFWQKGAFRLHERVVYTWSGENWKTERLYP